MQNYALSLGSGFDYDEYVWEVAHFMFTESGGNFAHSVCRTMLLKRNLPLEYIYHIEHHVLLVATTCIDPLLLEYDRLKALYPGQINSYRCFVGTGNLFIVQIEWKELEYKDMPCIHQLL